MHDKPPEDADTDLAEKQTAELEESIAAQSRIVDDLKAKGEDTTDARRFLEVPVHAHRRLLRLHQH